MKPIYKCEVCRKYVEEPIHCSRPCKLLLDGRRRLKLSKLLSGLLRHFPHEIGLKLDREGFTEQTIEEIVRLIKTRWRNKHLYQWLKPEHIYALVELDPKGRFEIRNNRIRARYGHSVKVNIKYEVSKAPGKLYHGTTPEALPKILREGLKPMKRLKVHLTVSIDEAYQNALRKTRKPVILEIDVKKLEKLGIKVFKAGKTIYVADYVPPEALRVLKRF